MKNLIKQAENKFDKRFVGKDIGNQPIILILDPSIIKEFISEQIQEAYRAGEQKKYKEFFGLIKEGHEYKVWLEKGKLNIFDENNFKQSLKSKYPTLTGTSNGHKEKEVE